MFFVVVPLAVHHEREEDGQDGVVGGQVEAELHDIPYRVLEGELKVRQLGYLTTLEI